MIDLKISDVRALSGDSAFLIDDGKTAVLYDTGFGFTGKQITQNIKSILKDRRLDYILLTHSHYDHVLGVPFVRRMYPEAKIIAGSYAAGIFAKPSAREKMRDLDRKFAVTCGVTDYEDLEDELKADITVDDGDIVKCGDMEFTVIALPGHTKCSVGFYLKENKLLLATETLGVYFGNNVYLPFFLVGYQMSLDSFKKARALDIESLLIPHYGLVDGKEAEVYLERSEGVARQTVEQFKEMILKGFTNEQIMAEFEKQVYTDTVAPTYPIDAFHLNTSIIIEIVRKECCQ